MIYFCILHQCSDNIALFNAVLKHSTKVDPESGSLLASLEGSVNTTTFTCNIFSPTHIEQQMTIWRLKNLQGNPELQPISNCTASSMFLIHVNRDVWDDNFKDYKLTVQNLTSDLDGVIVYCGTEQEPELANFTLRIYRKWKYYSWYTQKTSHESIYRSSTLKKEYSVQTY